MSRKTSLHERRESNILHNQEFIRSLSLPVLLPAVTDPINLTINLKLENTEQNTNFDISSALERYSSHFLFRNTDMIRVIQFLLSCTPKNKTAVIYGFPGQGKTSLIVNCTNILSDIPCVLILCCDFNSAKEFLKYFWVSLCYQVSKRCNIPENYESFKVSSINDLIGGLLTLFQSLANSLKSDIIVALDDFDHIETICKGLTTKIFGLAEIKGIKLKFLVTSSYSMSFGPLPCISISLKPYTYSEIHSIILSKSINFVSDKNLNFNNSTIEKICREICDAALPEVSIRTMHIGLIWTNIELLLLQKHSIINGNIEISLNPSKLAQELEDRSKGFVDSMPDVVNFLLLSACIASKSHPGSNYDTLIGSRQTKRVKVRNGLDPDVTASETILYPFTLERLFNIFEQLFVMNRGSNAWKYFGEASIYAAVSCCEDLGYFRRHNHYSLQCPVYVNSCSYDLATKIVNKYPDLQGLLNSIVFH